VEMLSATLPLAMSAAAVLAGGRFRERRRRQALNRAMHELRRPLQALVLARVDPARLEPVLLAVEELDGVINGSWPEREAEPVELRHLAEGVVSRWAAATPLQAARPVLHWRADGARVLGDRAQLARALDNLVANAIEHGRGPVEVIGMLRHGRMRILVRDGGPRRAERDPGSRRIPAGERAHRRRHDPRHGHGLEIVRAIAARHGGRFVLRRSATVTVAALDLPLAEPPLRRAA
jgi:signal transduction histidine kinase